MIILGPSSISSVNDRITYQLSPAGLAPFDEVDLSNETGVTFQVGIGGSVYLLSPQSTVRYPIQEGVTNVTLKPLTSPAVTGSVYGIAYTSQDPKPSQVARGSNFLGGAVGLPIDPLVLGASNSIVLGTQASGDTVDRWKLWADGTQQWGPGNAAVDVQLARSGAATLTLTGALTVTAGTSLSGALTTNVTGDVNVTRDLVVGRNLAVTGTLGAGATSVTSLVATANIIAKNADNYFGVGADGVANGTRLRLNAAAGGDTYVIPESVNLADINLHLRQKGAGTIYLETGGGAPLLTITSTPVVTTGGKLVIAAGGLDLVGSPSGYTGELRFTSTPGSGIYAISTLDTGTPTVYSDHRGTGNTGQWIWRNGTAAGTQRMILYGDGTLAGVGPNSYFGPYALGASGARARLVASGAGGSDVYLQAEASSGSANLILKAAGTGAIYDQNASGVSTGYVDQNGYRRYYNNAGVATAAIGDASSGVLFSMDTDFFTRWVNGSGSFAYSQVRLSTGADIRTGVADSIYFLRVT